MTLLLPTCWWENHREIQNLSGILFGNERPLWDFCMQQHIVEKHGLGYILLINQLIHQLKASSMWSLLDNPSAHLSAWTLTSASCFRGKFVLDLQTRRVNRSVVSRETFAVFPLEIHWIQTWKPPPHAFGIPVQETPPLPRNSKMPPVVWYGYFLESPFINDKTQMPSLQYVLSSEWMAIDRLGIFGTDV